MGQAITWYMSDSLDSFVSRLNTLPTLSKVRDLTRDEVVGIRDHARETNAKYVVISYLPGGKPGIDWVLSEQELRTIREHYDNLGSTKGRYVEILIQE